MLAIQFTVEISMICTLQIMALQDTVHRSQNPWPHNPKKVKMIDHADISCFELSQNKVLYKIYLIL